MTTRKTPKLGKAIDELCHREGSPCLNCLVDSACTKSFIGGSACYEFAEFIQNEMAKAGMLKNENKG